MMWKKRILAMAAATLALGTTAGGIAQAGDESVHERRAEANIDVPRNADGSIDGQAFVHEVDSLVAGGVREIHIRDASFTHEEARSLLIPLEGNMIGAFADRLPSDGIQRQITLHGDVDVRVQRLANGELRASIKDLVVVNPTEARRAEYTQLLAEKYGLDRLTVRAIDAEGNLLRVEYRADQGIVRNESRPAQGGEREHHADRHDERRAEMKLDVPRSGDGSIDVEALISEVDNLVSRGVREIRFRDATLSQDEARSLVLRIEGNLLGDLAARLPNDGVQRQITLRGDVDFRVQRQKNGELRASIKDIFVGSPTEARRAEFTEQLAAQYGFDRLTIRGVDADGSRIRVEFRADQGIVRNEARPGFRLVDGGETHADRGKHKHRGEHHAKWGKHHGRSEHHAHHGKDRSWDRAERDDGSERHAKFERKERGERQEWRDKGKERVERHARFERKERAERPEWRDHGRDRVERHAKFERKERVERPERREGRMERPERHVKFERPERHERVERPDRPERASRPERVERPERSGRD